MTETFSQIAFRASLHRTVVRRNQFSKRVFYPGEYPEKIGTPEKNNKEIIICN